MWSVVRISEREETRDDGEGRDGLEARNLHLAQDEVLSIFFSGKLVQSECKSLENSQHCLFHGHWYLAFNVDQGDEEQPVKRL